LPKGAGDVSEVLGYQELRKRSEKELKELSSGHSTAVCYGKTTLFLTNHSWEKRKTHIYHVFLIITVYFVRLELFTHKHIYIYYYILIYIYFF
jgi:hypothetical protein